ncbi:1-(5-phosphoribosyl)-5-[(5-phosphoribosylamino)methylideneamino]imidazole-4-carboxamide isomerase [Candidatus Poribacteria bacterium]|nr:1-(5-phosphoribosyl)-5-[(5-phosphoribosylamino)methylideneamino]imidazole-4-carboxamide isomerase [Candidatus Poribacteria bacterium]
MIVIPAIDLKGGRCVRLEQGKPEKEKVYSGDPLEVARNWAQQGAEWLHVVDLDGAFAGEPQNLRVLGEIRNAITIPIQFGGGVRTLENLEKVLRMGVNRVVLGTAAIESPGFLRQACEKFGDKIVAGIDARDGKVAVKGWHDVTTVDAIRFGESAAGEGARFIVYTDISRDGMLSGPNKEALKRMADAVPVSIIASGGISTLADVAEITRLAPGRIIGMIIGKALYEGAFSLKRAIDIAATSA